MCDLVKVFNEKRLIEIIEYPTVKIQRNYGHLLNDFEDIINKFIEKEKRPIKYNITKQPTQDGYFYITIR